MDSGQQSLNSFILFEITELKKALDMDKVALIFRGGISRESGRLLGSNSVSEGESKYVNFLACANSVKKNIIQENADFEFDVFFQSWNPDLKSKIQDIYNPLATNFENNSNFTDLITRLSFESQENAKNVSQSKSPSAFNALAKALRLSNLLKIPSHNLVENFNETFAGISSALAVQKSIELFEANANVEEYKFAVLYRPDVVLLKPLNLQNYNPSKIYCNHFADRMGDFHWITSPQNLYHFKDLLPSIHQGNYYILHKWIRDYFDSQTQVEYVSDDLHAGKDEEVLRKAKVSGIPLGMLQEFGVTEEQYSRY